MEIRRSALILVSMALLSLSACSTSQSEVKSELQQSAQAGDIDAQYRLGTKYARATFAQLPEAIYWLCRAAKDGHVPAQLELAAIYEKDAMSGDSGASGARRLSNYGNAYFWYTAAASQGSELAFDNRELMEENMDDAEIMQAKRRATRWQQSVCLEP